MANDLFKAMNGNQQNIQAPGIMDRFSLFCQQFRGNPEQTVRGLLSSGQMTQAQFNQLKQTADRLLGSMGRIR